MRQNVYPTCSRCASCIAATNEISKIWQYINSVKPVTVTRKYQKYNSNRKYDLVLDRNDVIASLNPRETHRYNNSSRKLRSG